MKKKFSFCMFILFSLRIVTVSGQNITDLSFKNKPIVDIVRVLAEVAGGTVIFDGAIDGRTSFVSPALPPKEALAIFLEQENLYGIWDKNVIRVSKVSVKINSDQTITLDAENVPIQDILLAISRISITPVVFDAPPKKDLTIHAKDLPLKEILAIIILKTPDYILKEIDSYFYIQLKRNAQNSPYSGRYSGNVITKEGDLYSLNLEQGRFRDVLDELFKLANIEYSYLGRNDAALSRLQFKSRTFHELLTLLCEQAKTDFLKVDRLYYVYDSQRKDVLSKYNSVLYRPLEHINVELVTKLIPPDLTTQGMIKTDSRNNALLLYGTLEQLAPLQEFLDLMDQPQTDKKWKRYNLDYLRPDNLKAILPPSLSMLTITPIPNTSAFIIAISPEKELKLKLFLEAVDRPENGTLLKLRYIKSEDLIANIPPSYNKEDFTKTQDPSIVFFRGSETKLKSFRKILESMDKPVPQIRYDLLVINYMDDKVLDWSMGATISDITPGLPTIKAGQIYPLTNLNIDVASIFGYQFALQLSMSLKESRSAIVADTTLNGLSGEKIKFRNTETYRIRDYRIDSTTGDKVSEGTRDVVSGLFIDIEGWVSGDGMITMKISTTISKQQDTTGTSDVPPTTERTVDTHVRTMDGKPLIISGLTQKDKDSTQTGVPGLSQIPVLGLPFKTLNRTNKNSELVIYIVPHIEYDQNNASDNGGLFERIYNLYVKEGQ